MDHVYKRELFEKDLAAVINRHCKENGSNTPDFVLARYLANCLDAYEAALRHKEIGEHKNKLEQFRS